MSIENRLNRIMRAIAERKADRDYASILVNSLIAARKATALILTPEEEEQARAQYTAHFADWKPPR